MEGHHPNGEGESSRSAADAAHDAAEQPAGEHGQAFIKANRRFAVARHDRDLQVAILGRGAPRHTPANRSSVSRLAHSTANRVDENVELRFRDFASDFDLVKNRRRRTRPRRGTRRFVAHARLGDLVRRGRGKSELGCRSRHVSFRDPGLESRRARIIQSIAAGERPPVSALATGRETRRHRGARLDSRQSLELGGTRPERARLSLGDDGAFTDGYAAALELHGRGVEQMREDDARLAAIGRIFGETLVDQVGQRLRYVGRDVPNLRRQLHDVRDEHRRCRLAIEWQPAREGAKGHDT